VSSNHDLSALLLVALAFGGFIVAAGTTTNQTELTLNQLPEEESMAYSKKALTAYGFNFQTADLSFIVDKQFNLLNTEFDGSNSACWPASPYHLNQMLALKVLNPSIEIIGYKNFIGIYPHDDDWATVNAQETWFIHDAGGNRIVESTFGWYLMDVGSVGWRQHWVTYVNSKMNNAAFNGVFADDVQTIYQYRYTQTVPAAVIARWDTDVVGMLQYATANLTVGKKLFINVDWNTTDFIDEVTNFMIEGYGHASWENINTPGTRTLAVILDQINALSTYSTAGKTVWCDSGTIVPDPDDTDAMALYCYCIYLLGSNSSDMHWSWNTWYSSDEAQGYKAIMDVSIGTPTGAYYSSQNVYMREFTDGLVLVNPSANNYNIVLAGYKFLVGGAEADNFTLNAYAAVILVPDAETLVYPTTAELSLSATTVEIDHPVSCTASFTGDVGTPTGTATFYVSLNEGLTWLQYGVAKTLVSGAATSIGYYPSIAGTYLFKAVYSGDANYATSSNSISFTVNNPVVATSPTSLGLLGQIITKMEAANVGDSYWDRGIWEDGMWEHDTPMINAIKQLESYSGIQTVSANVCEPGMDIITSPFKTVIQKLESY
jgi:hypothetical protein